MISAIVIMAKAPKPNEVKTRLIPHLKPDMAALLYHNFLLDKIEQVKSIEKAEFFIAYMPDNSENYFKKIAPDFDLILQIGNDLGDRLVYVSNKLFNKGFKKVVILDSDTPNLPTEYIRKAIIRLETSDIIIGPCEDGGYYLIGLKLPTPDIFKNIPWSTSEVVNVTVKRAEAICLKSSFLKYWYDIDTIDDLKRLKKDLEDSKEKKFSENTDNFLSKLQI
ncbi:MAG: TIGR04282 family arsenosugar biosynthesis glycosyltransferase [Candidatus Bathyarchaeota archaeon]|nr:TIGR04282 family arsenosugar biosynthesis glycosyltransferase [Candidatus Bathyarchaeota archaeon]MCZ2845398.1 TIGR04282 family arsenosugar biosynthesis glycosyltransferase [Candidatus Bathyarchaeota archaeon]